VASDSPPTTAWYIADVIVPGGAVGRAAGGSAGSRDADATSQ